MLGQCAFFGHSLRLGLGHDDLNMYKVNTFRNYYVNRVMDRVRPAGDTRPVVPEYTTVGMTVRCLAKGVLPYAPTMVLLSK
jgi:hypothetical protein